MQPLARGQIHIDSQTLLQQTLAGDQVERVEFAAGVIIDEQVGSLPARALFLAVDPNK
jgi:hypothetical protein